MALRKRQRKSSDTTPVLAPNPQGEKVVNKLDSVMISDGGEVRRQSPLARYVTPLWHRPKIRMVTIAVAVILVIGGGTAAYFAWRSDKPVVKTPSCSGELLYRAREVMEPDKVTELEPITNEIKQVPGYEQNVNCLAILLTYAINQSDAVAAEDYLAKLQAAYPNSKYDNDIARYVSTPDEYKPTVEFLKQQAVRYQNVDPATGAPR